MKVEELVTRLQGYPGFKTFLVEVDGTLRFQEPELMMVGKSVVLVVRAKP